MLSADVSEFTRPINSSMIFGGCPAAGMTAGVEMTRAIPKNYTQNRRRAIQFLQVAGKNTPVSKCDKLVSRPPGRVRLNNA